MTVLVDTESQISVLTEGFCTEIGLKIHPLKNLISNALHLREMVAFQYHIKDM